MKLHIDLETLQLIEGPGFRTPMRPPRFKRGDAAGLEVVFLAGGSEPVAIGDPNTLEIIFGLKPRNRYDAAPLVWTNEWTMPEAGAQTPVYGCSPAFNTLELNTELNVGSAEELSEITLMGEITWREAGGASTSTRTFLVVVENDVNRDGDAPPVALSQDGDSGAVLLGGHALPSGTGGTFALLSDVEALGAQATTSPQAWKPARWKGGARLNAPDSLFHGVLLDHGGVDSSGYPWWFSGTKQRGGEGTGCLLYYSTTQLAWHFLGVVPPGALPDYPEGVELVHVGIRRVIPPGIPGPYGPDPRTPFNQASWQAGFLFIEEGTLAGHPLPPGQAPLVAGDDGRLSDARAPLAHQSSHATGGTDPLAPSDIGAVASNPSGIPGAQAIGNIVAIPLTAYNNLAATDPAVTYIILPD